MLGRDAMNTNLNSRPCNRWPVNGYNAQDYTSLGYLANSVLGIVRQFSAREVAKWLLCISRTWASTLVLGKSIGLNPGGSGVSRPPDFRMGESRWAVLSP